MPTISMFYGIIIRMFYGDHAPPHFHVEYVGHKAIVDIQTFSVLEGTLPPRILTMVIRWAKAHQLELLNNWSLCVAHQKPTQIAPLP